MNQIFTANLVREFKMCQIYQMHCTNHCSKHNHKTSSVLRIVTSTIHSQNKCFILQLKYCKEFISEDYQCSTYTFKEYVQNTQESKT